MKKQLYEQPLAEVFEVRLQGSCLQTNVSNGTNWGNNPGNPGGDDQYDPNDGEGF